MSKYILYRAVWDGIQRVLHEVEVSDLDDERASEARAVALRCVRRYNFIFDIISASTGAAGTGGSTFEFVTICPPEGTEFGLLASKVKRFVERRYVKRFVFVYEQRSATAEVPFFGLHVHILIEHSSTHGIVKRAVQNLFAPWITHCDAKKEKWALEDKVPYLLGHKTEPKKQAMVERDRAWRLGLGIENIYFSGSWPTLNENLENGKGNYWWHNEGVAPASPHAFGPFPAPWDGTTGTQPISPTPVSPVDPIR